MNINFYGTIYGMTGYDGHCKQLVNALFKKNPQIHLEALKVPKKKIQLSGNEQIMLKNKFFKNGVSIAVALPPEWPKIWSDNSKHFVGFLVWEGDRVPKDWLKILNNKKVNQIWVPSNHTKQTVVNTDKKLERKIRIVPHGVNLNLFKPKKIKKLHKKFTFITNKGWARGINDRGGIQFLLMAFAKEFCKKESNKVALKVKINTSYNPPDWNLEKEIKKLNLDKDRPPIKFLTKMIHFNKLPEFYYKGDVFVSPTMSEGFGLTLAEAMACGVPAITTNFGGQTDFVNEKNGWLLDYKLTPSKQSIYKGVNWALPDINQLQKVMRYCVDNPKEVRKKGLQAMKDIKKFNWKNSASIALKSLDELN
jgi:glycosyltransferase involved in cell wall biosynthesis